MKYYHATTKECIAKIVKDGTIKHSCGGVVFLCTDKHKEIIDSYAKTGYHYAGFVPTEIDAKGCMRKIDLIFEKED